MIKRFVMTLLLISLMMLSNGLSVNAVSVLNVSSTQGVYMAPTSTFTIDVFMENPSNVTGFQMKILYETDKYELSSISIGSTLTAKEFISNTTVAGEIIVVYVDVLKSITSSEDVTLFSLTFKTLNGVVAGDNVLLTIDETYNQEFLSIDSNYTLNAIDQVNFTFQNVKRALKGDLDLNGTPGLIDVAKIQLYLANRANLSELEIILADTNGDSRVSIIDAARIQLFVAGLINEL